jgi:gliding motility-associated-like protein
MDTLGWIQTKGLYKAQGGEQWLTIGDFGITRDDTLLQAVLSPTGNFMGDVNETYYYLDDVSITLVDTLGFTTDTSICLGKQVSFGKRAAWDSCRWFDGATDTLKTFSASGVYWVTSYLEGLPVTDTFNLAVLDTAQSIITQTGFCIGSSAIILEARPSNTYLWNTGSTNPQLEASSQGIYTVTLSHHECLVTDTFYVTQFELPTITTVADTTVCFDEVAQILLDAGKYTSYLWKPTGETTQTIYSTQAQVYLLTVTDSNNCSNSIEVAVMETCPEYIFIPNAFTPNGDGINDVYRVATRSLVSFELSIYNRWGQLIFTTTDASQGWDGKNVPADAYVAVVNYQVANKPMQHSKGMITLVR